MNNLNIKERDIITICGSLSQKETIIELRNYILEKYKKIIIFTPEFDNRNYNDLNENELELYRQLHYKKIDLSNVIVIIYKEDDSIGENTKRELDYAKLKNKMIIYHYKRR